MNEEEILQNMDYVSEQLVGAAEAIKADTDERRFDEAYDPMLRDVMMMARELLHLASNPQADTLTEAAATSCEERKGRRSHHMKRT